MYFFGPLSILIWPLILFGQEAAKVAGRVASVDGAAITDAKVVLSSSDPQGAKEESVLTDEDGLKSDRSQLSRRSYYSPIEPLMVRSLNMKQLRWTFFHLRLWVFELKLWMDGLSWEQVRIVAERPKDLASATHERS